MGLFSKLFGLAKKNALGEVGNLLGMPESITERISNIKLKSSDADEFQETELDKENTGELDYSNFNEDFDENSYDENLENEISDEDLEELGEAVDELIEENDGVIDDDGLEELHEMAVSCGLSIEEFDKILESRLEELQAAIEAGYEPRDVYRTKSIWRRCPNCGTLNSAEDVYCYWCGYQLRHKAVSVVLGALLSSGAKGGDPKKLHKTQVSKAANKAKTAQTKRKEQKIKKSGDSKAGLKTTAQAPQKKSLFGSKPATNTSEKKKSLFGSKTTTPKSDKKTSLFGGKDSSKKKSLLGGSSTKTKSKSSFLSSSSSKSSKKGSLLKGASKLGKRR